MKTLLMPKLHLTHGLRNVVPGSLQILAAMDPPQPSTEEDNPCTQDAVHRTVMTEEASQSPRK